MEEKKMNKWKIFSNGVFKENPVFILLLGMCPVLGVTTSAINGLGMGLATAFVLTMANTLISALKNLIPPTVRIPVFVILVSAFVTVVDLMMQAYLVSLHAQLGLFIPLIVINCVVLARADSFAFKNKVLDASVDGLGMGIGFTLALVILGMLRELLGDYSFFGHKLIETDGMLVFILAPGGFFVLGFLLAIINLVKNKKKVIN